MLDLKETSPQDISYNCIAWAAEDSGQWWEPDPLNLYYWPENVARNYSLKSYVDAYKTLGYEVCENHDAEEGFKKIAIYADTQDRPKHAARYLENNRWTSKLGRGWDVEHPFVNQWRDAQIVKLDNYFINLSGYGQVKVFLKKSI